MEKEGNLNSDIAESLSDYAAKHMLAERQVTKQV